MRAALVAVAGGERWVTVVVNVAGCLLVGLVLGHLRHTGFDTERLLLLAVGVGGGFTTFSGAIADGLEIGVDQPLLGIVYGAGSIGLGLAAMTLTRQRR